MKKMILGIVLQLMGFLGSIAILCSASIHQMNYINPLQKGQYHPLKAAMYVHSRLIFGNPTIDLPDSIDFLRFYELSATVLFLLNPPFSLKAHPMALELTLAEYGIHD